MEEIKTGDTNIVKINLSMKLKKLITILCCMVLAIQAMADGKAKFEVETHDFGTIKESDGDVTYEFKFVNEGDSPLLITRAQASCGCTSPEYPKKPLRAGEKGVIKVTYHAKGRPGPFDKSVYVYTNSKEKEKVMLSITGNVISTSGPIDTYTEQMGGGLRLKTTSVNYFDVYPNRANRTRTLMCYNESDEPIRVTFRNIPKHIQIECDPEVIMPKGEGKVMLTYLADKVKDWGPRRDLIDIFVKGKETKMKGNHLTLIADIWEDFSELSKKERDNAAEVEVSNTLVNFGKGDKERSQEITVRNTGKDKLVIRKIHNEKPEVFRTELTETVLKPGQTSTIRVTFNPAKCEQKSLSHNLTIITNDPSNSRVIVSLQAAK